MNTAHFNAIESLLIRTHRLNVPQKIYESVPLFYSGFQSISLSRILESKIYDDVIGWSLDGLSFEVKGTLEFTDRVLQRFFGQTQFTSFCRLLNSFEFRRQRRKVKERNPSDVDIVLFCHDQFQRNRPDLVSTIRRRCSSTTNTLIYRNPITPLPPNRRSNPELCDLLFNSTVSDNRNHPSTRESQLTHSTASSTSHYVPTDRQSNVFDTLVPNPGPLYTRTTQQQALQHLVESDPTYHLSPNPNVSASDHISRLQKQTSFENTFPPFPYEALFESQSVEYETYFLAHEAMLSAPGLAIPIGALFDNSSPTENMLL